MTTEDDFHRILDANPNDHHTRLVFADWLQEHNDPRADGYRALGTLQRSPDANTGREHGNNWYWGSSYMEPGNHLPRDWWNRFYENVGQMHPGITRRHADDAAAHAFSRLPQQRREELLGQQSAEKLTRRRLSRRRYGK